MRVLSRAAGDRGVISIAAVVIMVLIASATAGGIYVATRDGGTPEAFVEVTSSSATRNAQGDPVITVEYRSAFAEIAALRDQRLKIEVHCAMQEQAEPRRNFTGFATFEVISGTSHEGGLTISPGPQNKDIKGAFRVSCDLWRDDTRIARSREVDLFVDEATAPPSPTVDVTEFVGTYRGTYKRVAGTDRDCDAESTNRAVTVADRGRGTIGVEIDAPGNAVGISSFDAAVSAALKFSGDAFLVPGDAAWKGLFTGQFEREEGKPILKATFARADGRCTYEYKGTMGGSSPTVVVVTLEQIKGVDGCRAVLDKARVKAGTITFKATNTTFGFAQVFVYDTGGNLVAHNEKDIPEQGGGVVEFTGELSAGNYTVNCDGPGGKDESTPLVAE